MTARCVLPRNDHQAAHQAQNTQRASRHAAVLIPCSFGVETLSNHRLPQETLDSVTRAHRMKEPKALISCPAGRAGKAAQPAAGVDAVPARRRRRRHQGREAGRVPRRSRAACVPASAPGSPRRGTAAAPPWHSSSTGDDADSLPTFTWNAWCIWQQHEELQRITQVLTRPDTSTCCFYMQGSSYLFSLGLYLHRVLLALSQSKIAHLSASIPAAVLLCSTQLDAVPWRLLRHTLSVRLADCLRAACRRVRRWWALSRRQWTRRCGPSRRTAASPSAS